MKLAQKTIYLSILLRLSLQAKQLEFKSIVEPICGIVIQNNESLGEINFENEKDAETAKFVVTSNSIGGAAKVKFDDITPSQNILNKQGYFKINHHKNKKWSNSFEIDVKNGEVQEISAHIPSHKKDITAGEARVTTTITIACD